MPTSQKMEQLRQNIVTMGAMIEKAVDTAMMALVDRSDETANEVISEDDEIDEMELRIDRACFEILRLERPDSENSRFVVAAIQIATDLERMGDLAVNIAQYAILLNEKHSIMSEMIDFGDMMEKTAEMVRESIRALVERNAELAWEVCRGDDMVDAECQEIVEHLMQVMGEDRRKVESATYTMFATQALERIGDQATNVAEEVIYMLEGRLIKHHVREFEALRKRRKERKPSSRREIPKE